MKPLNPIMAVLAIAFAGFPLRALAVDGKEPVKDPVGVAVEVEDKNSITRLTEILAKDPSAVKDAGERISEFLLNTGPGGASFVAGDVDTKALGDVATAWAKAQTPGNLAVIYFVVGTGDKAPSWVTLDPLLAKTVAPKRDAEGRLRKALERFTVKGGAQIVKKNEKPATTAFLGVALAKSKTIFDDHRPMPVVDESVNRNNTTAPQIPNTTRAPGSGFDGAAREYTFDDLYINGAVIKEVSGPNDANSRKISMKVYTRRVNGVIINEVGIFDVTDSPDDIFGQRFPIGTGKQEFILDDRKPGHKKYVLEFGKVDGDGNRAITFSRPDGKPENSAVTSVKELFNKRADQAEAVGNIVKVGGEEFYVLPQGGARTALALFPKAMIDGRRTDKNARLLEPALFAEVGKVGPNGRNQNVSGKPHLGTVGKTDFHLEFNKDLGVWEAKEGAGDPPEPPAKPDGAPGTTPGTTPGGNPGGGNQGGSDKPELAIADLEKLLLLDATCRKYDEDTSQIAPDLKGKYGMIMCNPSGKAGGDQAILLVPKRVWNDQQMIFKSIKANDTPPNPTPAATLIRGRIVDHYVVLQFDTQVQYLDLLKKTDSGFELAGLVSGKDYGRDAGGPPTGDGDRPGMNNLNMFMDALRYYMGVPANSEVFTEVPKRIKTEVGSAPLDLQAKYSNEKVLLVIAKGSKGEHFTIWPKVLRAPTPGSNQYAHLGGPANVFEPEVSSMDAPFKDKDDIANSYQLVRIDDAAKNKDIALYKATDPTGKDKTEKYYLSFKYLGVDTANADPASAKVTKVFKQKYFEAFNDDNPLPEKRAMAGLTQRKEAIVRGQLVYRFIGGTAKAKGVLAVFQNAALSGEGQKDAKQNCVGPIVWWGLSEASALKACNDDKF